MSAAVRIIHVAAAVIVRDGLILIGQRPKGEWGELEWEFPGGKLEPGEDPPSALARELREELDIHATIGPELDRYEFQYPGTPRVLLVFHAVTSFQGEPRNLAFEKIEWAEPAALPGYPFLKGDVSFVEALARGDFRNQLS